MTKTHDGEGDEWGDGHGHGHGYGRGDGYGYGHGDGHGEGHGHGYGYGRGRGNGDGYGNGHGHGYGRGTGKGNGRGRGNNPYTFVEWLNDEEIRQSQILRNLRKIHKSTLIFIITIIGFVQGLILALIGLGLIGLASLVGLELDKDFNFTSFIFSLILTGVAIQFLLALTGFWLKRKEERKHYDFE